MALSVEECEQFFGTTPHRCVVGGREAGSRAAGRFSLVAQRTEPTIRYVSVKGPVIRTAAASDERSREMAARYLPDNVAGYLEYERTLLSADLGPAW
jgi:hypothetical protein